MREDRPPRFVVPHSRMIASLLLSGWYDDVQAGHLERSQREASDTLGRWVRDGLPVRADGGDRFYDPVLTLNFMRDEGLQGKPNSMWRDRVVPASRRHAEAFGPAPPSDGLHDPRRTSLRLAREFVLLDRRPGATVLLSMPLPVDGPAQGQLVVAPLRRDGLDLRLEPGVLVARARVPEDRVVRLEVRLTFVATQQTVRLDRERPDDPWDSPQETAHLSAAEGLIQISPAIAELAASLRKTGRVHTIESFWEFFFDRMSSGNLYYDSLDERTPLDDLIRGRWFDCLTGSALFVAMCRAVDIPARVVHGLLLSPTDKGPHYWAEVFLPPWGWLPFDLHSWFLAGGDKRSAWSRFAFGHLPHQVVLFRLPRTQWELGIRFPPTWFSLAALVGSATRFGIYDASTGALVYADEVELLS